MLDQVAVVTSENVPLAEWVEERILPLRELDPESQYRRVSEWWGALDRLQRFMLLKILTGELRVGVSHTLVVRALAQAAELPPTTIAARMMGDWTSIGLTGSRACSRTNRRPRIASRPYPFFLASPLEDPVDTLGPRDRLDRRVEVGRHPGTARVPRRRRASLVARRRAHHASLSGNRRRSHAPA